MDERLRETLSSMMDDEADELSVRRLLSHGNQEDVRGFGTDSLDQICLSPGCIPPMCDVCLVHFHIYMY